MKDAERDDILRQLGERTAWIQGKLEEVHLRTAEIPRLLENQREAKLHLKMLWGLVVTGALISAPAVFAHVMEVLSGR